MKITKEMFPDYSIVRHTSYGREVDYAQVGFINISERDIAALLNGEILDVVGDLPILIRFQHDDNLSFGEALAKYMKDLPNSADNSLGNKVLQEQWKDFILRNPTKIHKFFEEKQKEIHTK